MLLEFVITNRDEIVDRCRQGIAARAAPRPTDEEMAHGVPLFVDQLCERLRQTLHPSAALADTATRRSSTLMSRGFTIAQVIRDYGGICEAIIELAVEKSAPITAVEFQILSAALDSATTSAVAEYTRLRETAGTERLGRLAHELRNALSSAVLAVDILKTGRVGIGGSTGAVLTRSLATLSSLIDRELAEVRLGAGVHYKELIAVCDFIEDVEVAATLQADARGLLLSVLPVDRGIKVKADRQLLLSMVGNLLQNAFKFTKHEGTVILRAHATEERVLIDVEDQCGGLAAGKEEELFRPFEQQSADRSGLGLGLDICNRGAQANGGRIVVCNHAGVGCTFTVDLPRAYARVNGLTQRQLTERARCGVVITSFVERDHGLREGSTVQ